MMKEAIIVAGGFGTRLQEVVKDVPKPMALVNDQPFLDYLLKYLAHYEIKRVVLSVGYLSKKIIEHYGNSYEGMDLSYAIEKIPLGTGGGIRLAIEQCKETDVLVLNGDSFFGIDLRSFYNKHSESFADGSLALRQVNNASRYGTITLGEFDKINSFHEKTSPPTPLHKRGESSLINAGIYLLGRENFMEQTTTGINFSIEKDFFEKKLNKLNLYGFAYTSYFIDIGIPEDYKQAQHDFKTFKY
ncbi:MAG: nucleotidyltransferase family protein [Bacteroidia bacterium]